jgi:hypothetical protein
MTTWNPARRWTDGSGLETNPRRNLCIGSYILLGCGRKIKGGVMPEEKNEVPFKDLPEEVKRYLLWLDYQRLKRERAQKLKEKP